MSTAHHTNLPTRTHGSNADPNFAGADEDPSEVTKLFQSRITAWGYAVDYLEDYVKATEKVEHSHVKEYEKVLKTVDHPLKEGHQFDQSVGGISGMFENIRSNTQGLAQSHNETAKAIRSSVLPIFGHLSSELKSRGKEVSKSAGKGSKAVDKARAASQKHIEKLGQHTAAFDSSSGKVNANDDPYVLHRGIIYRLKAQVDEENNNRDDLLQIQSEFARFEAHIVQSMQKGMQEFDQIMSRSSDQSRRLYGEMATHSTRVAPDFEWNGFLNRNRQMLIDPREPKRAIETMGFANQNHASTQAIIAGSLERKSKVLKKYETGFYAVTPSKFLHEFKSNDNFAKDPVPENSLFLPDCMIGALDGSKFAVKGKDASKGGISSKLSMSHEYQFQAQTPQEAQKWYDAIRAVAGQTSTDMPDSGSEMDSRNSSRVGTGNLETAGVPPQQQAGAAPVAAAPPSAVPVSGATAPVSAQTGGGVPVTHQEAGLGAHPAAGGQAPIGSVPATSGVQGAPSTVTGAPQQRI